MPGGRHLLGEPRSARAAATASSCRRSSTSSRCTSTPRRVSRRSAGRSRGRRRRRARRAAAAGRAGRCAAGRRRPRGRPRPPGARLVLSGAIGSGTRSRRPTPASSASCRQVSDSASVSARSDQLGVQVGGDGHLGQQVAQVADPALVGRPAGRRHDGLGELLGRGPAPAAANQPSVRTARRLRCSGRGVLDGEGQGRARAHALPGDRTRRPRPATVRRQAANCVVHLHLGGPGLEDDPPPPRSSNRPRGSPASMRARPVASPRMRSPR